MVKSQEWQDVESRYGEPMETLLPRKLNELGRMEDVADEFTVDFMTVYRWSKYLGIQRKHVYVVPEGSLDG